MRKLTFGIIVYMSFPIFTHINFDMVYYFVIHISFYGILHLIPYVVLRFYYHYSLNAISFYLPFNPIPITARWLYCCLVVITIYRYSLIPLWSDGSHKSLADIICGVMPHNTKIAIYRGNHILRAGFSAIESSNTPISVINRSV